MPYELIKKLQERLTEVERENDGLRFENASWAKAVAAVARALAERTLRDREAIKAIDGQAGVSGQLRDMPDECTRQEMPVPERRSLAGATVSALDLSGVFELGRSPLKH